MTINPLPTVLELEGRKEGRKGQQMTWLNFLSLWTCFQGRRDPVTGSSMMTKIRNASGHPVELQIRVGSILKKSHTLRAGECKRLRGKAIYKAYMPASAGASSGSGGGRHQGMKSLLYYYDETCQPYVWVHDSVGVATRAVKQQYISLEDLRDCSEIRIARDHSRGCLSVCKKPRP